MGTILFVIIAGGIIAGIVRFIEVKKIVEELPESDRTAELKEEPQESWWTRFKNFIRMDKEFFACVFLGIAGSLLLPLVLALTDDTLPGLDTMVLNTDLKENFDPWVYLVLLGYAIVSGYSVTRLLRGISTLMLNRINTIQGKLNQQVNLLDEKLEHLKSGMASASVAAAPQKYLENMDNLFQETPNTQDDEAANTELADNALMAACVENTHPNGRWRVAASLAGLLTKVNTMAPERKKDSDGTIGDPSHASRQSDHNPWVLDEERNIGVVTALDITHDPANGCDCEKLAKSLQEKKDSRIKYVIWNRKIMSSQAVGGSAAWTWRAYNGTNPHNKHIHISVKCDKGSYDGTAAWNIVVK